MDTNSAMVLCTLLHCLISMMPDVGPITRNHLFELLSQVEDGICKHERRESTNMNDIFGRNLYENADREE